MNQANEMQEIVFAPSIDWFKEKAKQLRKRIGRDSITHSASLNLLAGVYGFRNWAEFNGFKSSGHEFQTFWDEELDEKTLDERRYLQSSTLTIALGLSEVEALQVLDDVGVSRRDASRATPVESENILKIGSDLDSTVQQRNVNQDTPNAKAAQQPAVTYKKRRLVQPDPA